MLALPVVYIFFHRPTAVEKLARKLGYTRETYNGICSRAAFLQTIVSEEIELIIVLSIHLGRPESA